MLEDGDGSLPLPSTPRVAGGAPSGGGYEGGRGVWVTGGGCEGGRGVWVSGGGCEGG